MSFVKGVNLLPATGEFTYDSVQYLGQRVTETSLSSLNTYAGQASHRTDMDLAIDQLQADFPGCTTVALVIAWFFNSETAGSCQVYPSTTYINNGSVINPATGLPWPVLAQSFQKWTGSSWIADHWRCSGLTETSSGLLSISSNGGTFNYGGTPSDQSIVRCIQDLKARGLRVVFYPFLLGDIPGSFPWRGRITTSPDVSSAASSAVAAVLGSAVPVNFTRDYSNLTVSYSGSPTDWTFRRMILHYANVCVIAGGVDLFLLGSELRGLEIIRGPAWTEAGTVDGSGHAIWDYPFVNGAGGLIQLSDDVRSIFDGASLTKDLTGLHNLISYAADWSSWMGWQHTGSNPSNPGQWPHLDQLWAHSNIDLVCFDNYLPISDWTTGPGGLDVINWSLAAPSSWPPATPATVGLGLTGTPTLYSKPYLKANIEGGEKFNWFYGDSNNLGRGVDPNGTDLQVSLPEGDRLTQTRQPYYAGQEILAQKQLRWWWNNPHYAIYPLPGPGWTQQGPSTEWTVNSKSITFTEYGYPACDRATNQPNVFFDAKSSESATPFWSIWQNADGGGFLPKPDQTLSLMALQAVHEYWFTDTPSNNVTVGGVEMIQPAFCSIWNWDARPFPTFPNLSGVWGDAGNWQAGNWLGGKGPFIAPPAADAPPAPGTWPAFPTLAGQGWSVHYRPQFTTGISDHVSGRASRFSRMSIPVYEIEITFDILRMAAPYVELKTLFAFIAEAKGQDTPFTFPVPADIQATLGLGATFTCRFADDIEDLEEFMNEIWQVQAVKLRTVKGE